MTSIRRRQVIAGLAMAPFIFRYPLSPQVPRKMLTSPLDKKIASGWRAGAKGVKIMLPGPEP